MKQKDLIVGKEYNLKYTLEHCSSVDKDGLRDFVDGEYVFVGNIKLASGCRNIFIQLKEGCICYSMFSSKQLDYIVEESEVLLKKFISDNNIDKKLLQKIIKEL